MELTFGAVFPINTVAIPAAPSEIPSFGVTKTLHCSPFSVAEDGNVLDVYDVWT